MNQEYEVVIGLEMHAELKTESKIYCSCKNAFGAEVNTNCCPICMGMPGTLPTLNEKVVEFAVKMGLATGCTINRVTKQDRKNYFYPDLPKGYQISQFDIPLCEHGQVEVPLDEEGATKMVGITRIHIEEDAGKLLHEESFNGSLVDLNRCGVPLIEIVSEPDLRSAKEAGAYLETMRAILLYLGICDGKMQEGSIRCDVNVSVMPKGSSQFGTRCEMKNVNSFSATMRAIDYEAARQIAILQAGGQVQQETRRWDDVRGESVLLRSKEDAHDYRYFPEPDLKTIVVPEEMIQRLTQEMPELPVARLRRYRQEYQLPHFDADLLVQNPEKGQLFEQAVALGAKAKAASNWILGDVTRILYERRMALEESHLTAQKLADMLALIEQGTISNTAGKTVIEDLILTDQSARQVVEQKGLAQVSDQKVLEELAAQVLSANPKAVEDYKKGKTNVLGFLVGQCMKASKGKGNPEVLRGLLEQQIQKL